MAFLSIRRVLCSSVAVSLLVACGAAADSPGPMGGSQEPSGGAVGLGGGTPDVGGSTSAPGIGGSSAQPAGGLAAQGGGNNLGGSGPQTGGGAAAGGPSTGGAAMGNPSTGGAAMGNPSTGGAAMGNPSAGGAPFGGPSTGGAPTGGAPTGGAPTGGSTSTAGLGAWTTGYVATMFGNTGSGDCSGYTSFSDSTAIDTYTCRGAPGFTLSSYQSGVANNASYYGATGDLSSLWVGGQCTCQAGGTGDCAQGDYPSCPSEKESGGNCGMCVAVKCDPNGTFTYSSTSGTHNQDCSTSTYVVVQILDACPHNHPTNVASGVGWCTSRQANHIDLSCSGLGDISTKGKAVGEDGWLNVAVQKVDCSVGLGKHSL